MPQPPDDVQLRRLRHDLRGVVNEMRLCVEVLRGETDADEALAWLEQIERAAERAALLLSQMSPEE